MNRRTRARPGQRTLQVARIGLAAAVVLLAVVGMQALAAGSGTSLAASSATPPDAAPTVALPVEAGTASSRASPLDRAPMAGMSPPSAATRPAPSETIHPEVLETAARRAPFSPGREPAPARYRLPGDRVAPTPPPLVVEEPAAPTVPPFQLLGAVAGNGSDEGWVILSVLGEEPRVLAVGESMHGYRVAQVVGASAMLTGGAGNFRVTVADPSPTGPAAAIASEGPEGNRRNQVQEARVQQREMQQRAVELARQLQQRMGAEGGQVRIEGDRVILTSRDGRDVLIQRAPPATPLRRPPGGGDR